MLSRASSSRSVLGGAKSLVTVAARAALSTVPPPLPEAVPTTAYDGLLAFARDGYKEAAANAKPVGITGRLTAIELPAGLPELIETHPRRLKQPLKSKNLLFVREDVQKALCADRLSADVALLGGSGTGKSGLLTAPALDWLSRRTRAEGAAQSVDFECVPGDLFVHVHGRSFTAFLRDNDAELGFVVEQTSLKSLTTADVELELLERYPSLKEQSSRYLFDPAGHGAALAPAFSAVPLLCGAQTVIAASPRAVSHELLWKRRIHKIRVADPDRALFREYAKALGFTDKQAALVELLYGRNLCALGVMDAGEALHALYVLAERIGRFGSTEITNTPLSEADHAALSSLIVGYDAAGHRAFRPLILTAALGGNASTTKSTAEDKSAQTLGAAPSSSPSSTTGPAARTIDLAAGDTAFALLRSVHAARDSRLGDIPPAEAKVCAIAAEVFREHVPAVKALVAMRDDGGKGIEDMDAAIEALTASVKTRVAQRAKAAGINIV